MQSAHVSASMREQLREKLQRLSEQASQRADSRTSSSSPQSPVTSADFPNSCTTPPSQTLDSKSVDESKNQHSQRDSSPSDRSIPTPALLHTPKTGKSPHPRPPGQLLRHVKTMQNTASKTFNKSIPRTVKNSRQRNTHDNNSANRRKANKPLPEWRANSRVQDRDWTTRSCPSNIEKLNTLDKQLSFALSNCERETAHRETVLESEHAFIDNSPVHDFHERIPDPAKTYPFELDDFQKRAILQIEEQTCVFVAAHTSAGKTAIAEYAIALAALGGTKVFYTSPIKSLSNQKLRDFRGIFDDVGLVTGDVSINEDAQCVIMTTEILRSMLYRGADVIRDVSYVIFDEVQFLNDEERGVVWEESIIMLPPHIGIIMLSATVPNALEFASWVGKTKERRVAVVCTNKRPVPLEHAILYPGESSGGLEASLLLEKDGQFLGDNFSIAAAALKSSKPDKKKNSKKKKRRSKQSQEEDSGSESVATGDKATSGTDTNSNKRPIKTKEQVTESASTIGGNIKKSTKGRNENKGPSTNAARATVKGEGSASGPGPNSRHSPWTPLIRFLCDKDQTPAVVFCFSKKGCEKAVESLEGSDLLPNAADKAHVHKLFEAAIQRLCEEDRNLPQVKRVFANLKRGISAHHAGLLPIVKEITEILFSEGLVKVLFATETFAMGVNMPARTVVFAGVRKNDGRRFRALESGEYTQMSGRAGRRGKDKVGNVYLFFQPGENAPEQRHMKYIMTGRPISLKSAFRLTYNMILNVLRVDELRVEEVMKRSFSEARGDANQASIHKVLSMAGDTLNQVDGSPLTDSARLGDSRGLSDYVRRFSEMSAMSSALTARELNVIFKEALGPGRLLIAEMDIGRLCLSVLFSVVPRYGNIRKQSSNSGDEENAIKRDTQVWLAYLHSVIDRRARNRMKSILLLPESTDRYCLSKRTCRDPCVVTSDGLVIALRKVQASKIVYIFDERCEFSTNQAMQQARATKAYHFSGKSQQIYKWLSQNACYIQDVVHRWERSLNQNDSLFEVMSKEWSAARKEAVGRQPKRNSYLTSKTLHGYQAVAGLCREMVTLDSMRNTLVALSGPGLMAKIEELIVQERIRKKLATLKNVQETGYEPRLLPEYQNRIAVLQNLEYVGSDGLNVQLKGRCGCEVLTADSLVLTEIVCENILIGLSPAEVASLLSCLVCRKKNMAGIHDREFEKYSETYCNAKAQMRNLVRKVGKVQEECSVQLDFEITDGCEDYESSVCRWDLAEAVYEWANGEPFCNITDLTEQQEGDIVVCVKRLSELLKDAQSVAKGVGNVELVAVLEDAVSCIRRDVIFNGSLYYDEDLE